MPERPDHVAANRESWQRRSDAYQRDYGELFERHEGRAWGAWRVPESDLNVLGDVEDLDVLELGCGAARWSIGLARVGAKPIGLDVSSRQLDYARRAMEGAGVAFPLVEADAERVPLRSERFDLIFCDHGAFSVADPLRVMPECARLLRDGGLLAFCTVSPILDVVYERDSGRVDRTLRNDYFGLRDVQRNGSIEFQLPMSGWVRLFRTSGFEIEDLIELRPSADATTVFDLAPLEWALKWPAENIWKARRRR
jgi:SAM-dependent methyltransferase